MKIAQVVCTYPPYRGGIGNVASIFSKKLGELGHELSVFTPQYQPTEKQVEGVHGLKTLVKSGNAAFLPSLLFKLRKFDTIIFHYPFFGTAEVLWLYLYLKPRKQKVFLYYHMDVVNSSWFFKLFSIPSRLTIKSLFRGVDRVMCSSLDYIKHSNVKHLYAGDKDRFLEIPFGVDTQRFYPNGEKSVDKTRILFVGGLDRAHYFKGLKNLLKAFSLLSGDNLELKVVGGGELLADYQKMCQELNCSSRVVFASKVGDADLLKCYQEADVFVLPSVNRCEAFGLVLLEAMACATAVIASDLPGVRTVFRDGQEGLLAKTGDVDDLVLKLQKLVDNPSLRLVMAKNAKKLVDEKYSWDAVTSKLNKEIS